MQKGGPMSKIANEVVYLNIGTIAMPKELADKLKAAAIFAGSIAAAIRIALESEYGN